MPYIYYKIGVASNHCNSISKSRSNTKLTAPTTDYRLVCVLPNFCKIIQVKRLIVFQFGVTNKSCVVLLDMVEANVLQYAVFVLDELVPFAYIVDAAA